MNRYLGSLIVVAVAAGSGFSACGDDGETSRGEGKMAAVTSLPLFADFLREIGGERIEVTSIMPAGADPHTYEPAPRQVKRVGEADILVVNGLNLEPAVLKVVEANKRASASLVRLGEAVVESGASALPFMEAHDEEEDSGHGEQGIDPHLWLDVANAREYALVLRDALSQTDPEGTPVYQDNYQRYVKKLDELDAYVRGKVNEVAPQRRKLITTHDAFGYMTRYMGLELVGVVAPSPGQEASPSDLAGLLKIVSNERVPAVFAEPQLGIEGDILDRVADDAGIAVCTLYSDSLDDKVKSYIELMRFNADEIVRCLNGGASA